MKRKKIIRIHPDFSTSLHTKKPKSKKKGNLKKQLEYSSIGWYIVIPILLFIGLGKFLVDKKIVGEEVLILFVVAGIVALIYNLGSLIKKLSRDG